MNLFFSVGPDITKPCTVPAHITLNGATPNAALPTNGYGGQKGGRQGGRQGGGQPPMWQAGGGQTRVGGRQMRASGTHVAGRS